MNTTHSSTFPFVHRGGSRDRFAALLRYCRKGAVLEGAPLWRLDGVTFTSKSSLQLHVALVSNQTACSQDVELFLRRTGIDRVRPRLYNKVLLPNAEPIRTCKQDELAVFQEIFEPVLPICENFVTAGTANEARMLVEIVCTRNLAQLSTIKQHVLVETTHCALQIGFPLERSLADMLRFGCSIQKKHEKDSFWIFGPELEEWGEALDGSVRP